MVKSITEDNKPGRRPGRKAAGGQHSQLFRGVSKTMKGPISRYPNGQGNARFNPADVFKLTLGKLSKLQLARATATRLTHSVREFYVYTQEIVSLLYFREDAAVNAPTKNDSRRW